MDSDCSKNAKSDPNDHVLLLHNQASLELAPAGLLIPFRNSGKERTCLQSLRDAVTSNTCNSSEPLLNEYKTDVSQKETISYFDILWAQYDQSSLSIDYVRAIDKEQLRPYTARYTVGDSQLECVQRWVQRLLELAYGKSRQKRKRIKVLINPFGGQRNASRLYSEDAEPILRAAKCVLDVETTRHQGHAVEIARSLDIDAYDVIASCSGDGLPHEVFNGLGQRDDAVGALAKIAVVHLPCGSGNALSWNFNGTGSVSAAALSIVKGIRTTIDLTSITQGKKRTLSFLSQSLGMVADVDCGTEHLRWMGSARFTYGFLVRIMRQRCYPCKLFAKVEIDSKAQIRQHCQGQANLETNCGHSWVEEQTRATKHLPLLQYGDISLKAVTSFQSIPAQRAGSIYAGNLPLMAPDANFFPAAFPSDGMLDLAIVNGDIGRLSAIKLFINVETGRHFDMTQVAYRKVSAYRVTDLGPGPGYFSVDGERMPFEPFQAEVHRGLGCTLSRDGGRCELQGNITG